jgi:hypothetical protein
VAAIKDENGSLPEKTVGITFEGAYLPTLNTAAPLLREAGFPFTVFYSADQANAASPTYMSFSQLKTLKKDKRVTLGILPSAYARLSEGTAAATLVNKAVSRHREVFGEEPLFFA